MSASHPIPARGETTPTCNGVLGPNPGKADEMVRCGEPQPCAAHPAYLGHNVNVAIGPLRAARRDGAP